MTNANQTPAGEADRAAEFAALATQLVEAAEQRSREEVARRIASLIAGAHADAAGKAKDDEIEKLRNVIRAASDQLQTIEALVAATAALAKSHGDSDQERMVYVIGDRVEDIVNDIADYV